MLGRVADALSSIFFDELLKTEDFLTLEHAAASDTRTLDIEALRKCIERFCATNPSKNILEQI